MPFFFSVSASVLQCIILSTLFLVGTSYMDKNVCVVLAVVFRQLFLLTVTLWFRWLCRKSLWLTADDRISDQTGFSDASVDGLGTLTRLNSIADTVKCFGYNIILAWAHVSQSNETLMANHGAWILSGRPIGLLPKSPYTQNLIDIWLWVLTITQHFAWVSRVYFCESLAVYKLIYSNHVFLHNTEAQRRFHQGLHWRTFALIFY